MYTCASCSHGFVDLQGKLHPQNFIHVIRAPDGQSNIFFDLYTIWGGCYTLDGKYMFPMNSVPYDFSWKVWIITKARTSWIQKSPAFSNWYRRIRRLRINCRLDPFCVHPNESSTDAHHNVTILAASTCLVLIPANYRALHSRNDEEPQEKLKTLK